MNKWMLLAAAIVLEVGATLSLRAMEGFTYPWFLPQVVLGYVGAFYVLSKLMATGMSVGVVYGIWAASGVALTAVLGSFVFGDALTWLIGLGIALIIGGVLLVELGSQRAHRQQTHVDDGHGALGTTGGA